MQLPFTHSNKKQLAVLIDPDKLSDKVLDLIAQSSVVDIILVGGSLLHEGNLSDAITKIKAKIDLPIYIFPGSHVQVDEKADGILLLSLISGRNADYLIGQHVLAAPSIQRSGIRVVPTGYMLVDCGNATTASYISNTMPLPYNKPEIAACTALAGHQLGMRHFYLDGGSGAERPVNLDMISQVKKATNAFLTVGGGIKSVQELQNAWMAGADLVVIGTAFENEPEFLHELENLHSDNEVNFVER